MDDAVLARIDAYWQTYGRADAWNFITVNLHNGDLYSVLTLLRPFRKLSAGGHPIRLLAIGRTHAQIAALFRDVLDDVVYTPDIGFSARDISHWRAIRKCDGLTTGAPIPLNFIDYVEPPLAWGGLWFLFNEQGIFYMHLFKFLLGLQLDVAPSLPAISPHSRSAARELLNRFGLPANRTLILFPYAQTPAYAQHPERVRDHFAALVARATDAGLEVCTSIAPREEPVTGTRGVFIPFGLLTPLCELAGYAVTVRSGISDMLSISRCRKLHIYPSQWAADRVSPLALGLGGVEQNLAFDFIGRPDPEAFANIALAALLGPGPADGSAYVPRLVLDLLGRAAGRDAPNGRFRGADFLVRSEYYRRFTSGVLAEGWSAAEDWGAWTLGYRAILYLQSAAAFGFDQATVGDQRVVLLLDLRFAIAEGTHDVLDFAIEVNGDITYHQARWPDHWRIFRLALSSDALTAPLRVTFEIENPVSTRVLSNGKTNDGRVIGIGLLKATYELAQSEEA